jgi:hypothetical protein
MNQILPIQEFKKNYVVNLIKISILVFFSVMIFSSFVPYYEATPDSYLYAIKSMSLIEGKWTVENKNLENTGDWVYVPNSWKKTVHDTAIPKYPPGLPAVGSIFYLIGGVYGLFYLGPILGIILLITSERIATNFFGKYVGLLTLILLSTNGIIWVGAKHLLADNLFTIVTIIGFFFLIKFLEGKKFNFLVFSSLFLSISGFVRLNGLIYFPIEIIIVASVLIYELYTKKSIHVGIKNENSIKFKFDSKNLLKLLISIIAPWLIFIIFISSFNNYYFGDPSVTFYNIPDDPWVKPGTGSYLSILELKNENFELIKQYSNFVLPYPIYKIETLDFEKIQTERDDPLTSSLLITFSDITNHNNLGLLTFVIMSLSIVLSILTKTKSPIIIIFSFIIFISIIFWSAGHISFGRDSVFGRYLIPVFPLFSMVFSFLIINFLRIRVNKFGRKIKIPIKIIKILIIVSICVLLIVAFYNSPPLQLLKDKEFVATNPFIAAQYYPLDKEGLNEKSIILGGSSSRVLDYGFNTFDAFSGAENQRMSKVFNPELLEETSIEKLITLISNEKNDIFIFKNAATSHEKLFREGLVNDYDIILKEYSTTFCIIKSINSQIENLTQNNIKSDDVCFG